MTFGRVSAALIAVAVFATLALRIWLRMTQDEESVVEAVWGMYRYYTIWTNTLIGVVCTTVALGRAVRPQTLGNMFLSIIIVAAVYHALLADMNDFTGLDALVDNMLHSVVPVAFVGFWTMFAYKSDHVLTDVLPWLGLPLVYCIYAMGRAQFDGVYPYFFLDLETLGFGRTLLNILGILVAFATVGAAIVLIANVLSRFDPATRHPRV